MLRATLKSMLSRKLRLVLSTIAVLLGVMFIAGSQVLTDTLNRSFENLFRGLYESTEIEVTLPADPPNLLGLPQNIPAADVARIERVSGVADAEGSVFVNGARVIGPDGKVVINPMPRFGASWSGEDELLRLREGRGPSADSEVTITANLAKSTGYGVGDTIQVKTNQPGVQAFTVVGIAGYSGGRDSLTGETVVFFTERAAQLQMLGETDVFSSVYVDVASGHSLVEVRDRIQAMLGDAYRVRTGEEAAAASADGIKAIFSSFDYLLIGFASIALFVGMFLILNTFSIVIAQRTRELALLRALGASRRQVIGSVLIEAGLIGLVAATIGLAVGVGIGALLGGALGGLLSGGALELAPLAVPARAIIAAYAIGVGVTLIAALLPAIRAARIPPVAAMRDSAGPDKPLTALSISGLAVLAVGGATLGLGLAGKLGDYDLWGVLIGMLVGFVGIALLTPAISRPVVSLLGRLVGSGAAGKLGRRNSARNPRRTAITASALMIGIAIVTAISIIMNSYQRSTEAVVREGVDAELVVANTDIVATTLTFISPQTLENIRALPGVDSVVGLSMDLVRIDGVDELVTGVDDSEAATAIFAVKAVSGQLRLQPGEVVLDDRSAADRGLTAGSTVTVQTQRGGTRTYTIAGIYERTGLVFGFIFGADDTRDTFTLAAPLQAFVQLAPSSDVASVRDRIQVMLASDPEISVTTMDELVATQAQLFSFILVFVQLLLGLAMLIAVLGVVNTLALSMTERTRELGLLRAVGMRRRQVMWMVTVESTVISVFGALLGIAAGTGLGVAAFQALHEEGFDQLAIPWPLMVGYLIASVVVGLVAGLIPAVRAARQDVLAAIAYE